MSSLRNIKAVYDRRTIRVVETDSDGKSTVLTDWRRVSSGVEGHGLQRGNAIEDIPEVLHIVSHAVSVAVLLNAQGKKNVAEVRFKNHRCFPVTNSPVFSPC